MLSSPATPDLLDEVRALRATVSTLQRLVAFGQRLTLRPVQPHPFLGQPVTIVATVTEGIDDAPAIDAPVTVTTTWGRLRTADGYTMQEGTAVTAKTGLDGAVRLTLLPPTSEALWDAQQDALEAMLRLLDAEAATPRDAEAGLREMARQYRWEANLRFRQAVDLYFQELHQRRPEATNVRDQLSAWAYLDATVVAFVRAPDTGEAPGTAVRGTAALPLAFKDWLGPWLQAYLELSTSEGALRDTLSRAAQDRQDEPDTLLEDVHTRVRRFIDEQHGAVGQFIGRRVAEASLQTFLETDVPKLPLDTRLSLLPSIKVTSGTIARGGATVLTAVGQVRADLHRELTAAASVDRGRLDQLGAHVEQLGSRVESKLDAGAFTTFQQHVSGQLDRKVEAGALDAALATRVDVAALDDLRDRLTVSLDAKADSTRVSAFEDQTRATLNSKADGAALAAFQTQTTAALNTKANASALTAFQGQMQTALAAKADTSALAAKADAAALTAFQTQTTAALNAKANASALTAFQGQMQTALAAKADTSTLTTLRTDFEKLATSTTRSLDTLHVRTDDLQTQITQLPRRDDLTDLLKLKVDVSTFAETQRRTDEALRTKVDVARFDQQLTTKVDTVRYDQEMTRKVDAMRFDQELATKVDTTLLTTRLRPIEQNVTRISARVFG